MKKLVLNLYILLFLISSCSEPSVEKHTTTGDSLKIVQMLDQFNEAAADADFNNYFNFFTEDAVFIGTDATENWTKQNFMTWAKPHFDKKKTWHFTSIDRHIYFSKTADLAWFDELLNTQMKIRRGSGVLLKQNNEWKIQQYVLSMTIPNPLSDTVVKIKAPIEDELIEKLGNRN